MSDITSAASAGPAAAEPALPLLERLGFRGASGVGEAGWLRTLLAAIVSLLYFFPVLWIILTAFKTYDDVLAVPAKFIFTPTLDNFRQVFSRAYSVQGQVQDTGFTLAFINSIVIATISVTVALVIGTFAAFGFSRYPLKGNDTYLFIVLTTRMLPAIVVIIPIFLMFRVTGLAGTHLGLILTWNEFLFALLLSGVETRTVPVAMAQTIGGDIGVRWGLLAATETLFLVPVIVVTFTLQNQLLRGVTFGTIRR